MKGLQELLNQEKLDLEAVAKRLLQGPIVEEIEIDEHEYECNCEDCINDKAGFYSDGGFDAIT